MTEPNMFRTMEAAVVAIQPDYPPKQSMGGINAFAMHCDEVGYRPGYAVCLHKIDAYFRVGKLKDYPACERAISFGSCPATKMRGEEEAAGKALYFIDRELLKQEMDRTFARLNEEARPKAVKRGTPLPPLVYSKAKPVQIPEGHGVTKRQRDIEVAPTVPVEKTYAAPSYADAINAAIRDSGKEPAALVVAAPAPVRVGLVMVAKLSTESMGEYAARVRASRV